MLTGFIDLQLNGYAGADFNSDALTADIFHSACERLQQDGVAGVLATVITDEPAAMQRRLRNLVALRNQSALARQLIVGIHIEGPFISPRPGYIGAHPQHAACHATLDATKALLDAAGGLTRILTLDPDADPDFAVTRYLREQGIIVSAGHCAPAIETLRQAIDHGLMMFTHLGNGCPAELHRHDNIIQRVLSLSDDLWISFIADGAHVPPFALANYLRAANPERTVIVTDAISAAGLGPGTFTLGDQTVEIGEDLIPWSADRTHFVGSAATMPRMYHVLRDEVGLSDERIRELTIELPSRLLGLDAHDF